MFVIEIEIELTFPRLFSLHYKEIHVHESVVCQPNSINFSSNWRIFIKLCTVINK
jgi:hypothetical protein